MPRTTSTNSLGLRKVKEFSGWWKTYEGISNGTDGLGYNSLDAKTIITEDWVIVPFSHSGAAGVYIYPRNSNTALYTITLPGPAVTDIAATNTHIVMSDYFEDDVWLYTIADLQPGNNTAFTWTSSLTGIYGADVAINSTHVFVGDSSNNRIRVMTLNGTFVTTINNPNVEPSDSNDQFYHLAANDSFLVVGAASEDLNGSSEGVVYLFSTSNWLQEYLIEAPGPGTFFGFNVQINDNYLVVGHSLSNNAWVYTLNELPAAPATVTTPNYRISAIASTGNYDATESRYMTLSSGNTHWLAMPEGGNGGNWLSVWNIENLTAYPAVNQTAEKYLTSVYANSWAQWPGVDVSNTELTIVTPNTANNGWTQYNKFFKPKRVP